MYLIDSSMQKLGIINSVGFFFFIVFNHPYITKKKKKKRHKNNNKKKITGHYPKILYNGKKQYIAK